MATLVNVGGALVSPEQARVSVFDRGFLYGDSVYEVIRTYAARPFELDAHLARLRHSGDRLALALPWDAERTEAEILRTLGAAKRGGARDDPAAPPWNRGEWYVRVVMTRGAGEIGLDPSLAVDPAAIVIVTPLHGPPAEAYSHGVKAVFSGTRRGTPAEVDPSAKTGAHLANVLAVGEARAAGAHEALLLDAAGQVTEGSSSNVFAVTAGRVATPPLAAGILEGVTRGVVLRLAREVGVPCEERTLRPEDLEGADEVFITSTVREIVPVVALGEHRVGSGRPGSVTERLHREFRRRAGGPVGLAERR